MVKNYRRPKNPIYQTTDISNFMFTASNINKLILLIQNPKKPEKKVKEKKDTKLICKPLSTFLLPKYDDKLFWCWMIFFYGISDYEFTQNQNWQRESLEKIKMIEEIRKHKQLLKELKLKRNRLEEELMSSAEISLDIIIILCAIHNHNLIYIKGKMYYKYESNSPNKTLIIQDKGEGAALYIGDNPNEFETHCINLWRIYNIKKPLKSLTVYKLRDLQKISSILEIPTHNSNGKRKTKKVLYQLILNQI